MASGLNLFVVPLDKTVDDEILRIAFSEYGELFNAEVAKDENGASKGFGFVHFCSVKDGLRAKEEMDNTKFFSKTIHVKHANKQEGRYYRDRGKNTKWANDWNKKSDDDTQELESVCDAQSQYSYATTKESHVVEATNIGERMRNLFESQSFTDVTFYPKNSGKMSISAHRAILAASSPLFAKMLYDDQNKMNVGDKLEVHISNLSFDAFICIVKYLYTDEVCFDNNDALVQGILDGAKQFSIYPLVNKCKDYIENVVLTSDNVCSKLQISLSNKVTVLKERCFEFIQRNTFLVIQSPDFQKCNSTTVREICKLQSFNLRSEVELLDGVMHWLRVQPQHEKKSLLEHMLKCIRILTLTPAELGQVLEKYKEIMTSDEGLKIMLFLYNAAKNHNSLPSWCNKNTQNRCFFKEDTPSQINVERDSGKVILPLKSDPGQGFISELTSLLQMKCISGFHQIKSIKLTFERPMSEQSRINDLLIKVHVSPSGFNTFEQVQIVNSESVRVEFRKIIKVRRGDTLDIEAEAKNIKLCKFLQFDEAGVMPSSPHFNTSISSIPKQGKLYFISEIEYGPQGPRFIMNVRAKNRNVRK